MEDKEGSPTDEASPTAGRKDVSSADDAEQEPGKSQISRRVGVSATQSHVMETVGKLQRKAPKSQAPIPSGHGKEVEETNERMRRSATTDVHQSKSKSGDATNTELNRSKHLRRVATAEPQVLAAASMIQTRVAKKKPSSREASPRGSREGSRDTTPVRSRTPKVRGGNRHQRLGRQRFSIFELGATIKKQFSYGEPTDEATSATLGSTMIADRGNMYQVDQSINLKDTESQQMYTTDPIMRSNRRRRKQSQRGSVMDFLLGRTDSNNSQEAKMVDIAIGPDPIKTGTVQSQQHLQDGQSKPIYRFLALLAFVLLVAIVIFSVLLGTGMLSPCENLVLYYKLTSPVDLHLPTSSPHMAILWLRKQHKYDDYQIEEEDFDSMYAIRTMEKYVLAVLYYATHPASSEKMTAPTTDVHRRDLSESIPTTLSNWMEDGSDVCEWNGIRCGDDGLVTHIKLPRANLTGTIPSELQGLRRLEELDLSQNYLRSSIPPSIGNLTQLGFLNLKNNSLTGPLHDSLGALKHLHEINFLNNSLTGTIPMIFRDMPNIKYILFSQNQFVGPMPPFTNMPKLRYLYLNHNHLHGEIPAERLSELADLEQLLLDHNDLAGNLTALCVGEGSAKLKILESDCHSDSVVCACCSKCYR